MSENWELSDSKKTGKMINVGVSVKIRKNIMHAKKITFRILLHALVKMVNI